MASRSPKSFGFAQEEFVRSPNVGDIRRMKCQIYVSLKELLLIMLLVRWYTFVKSTVENIWYPLSLWNVRWGICHECCGHLGDDNSRMVSIARLFFTSAYGLLRGGRKCLLLLGSTTNNQLVFRRSKSPSVDEIWDDGISFPGSLCSTFPLPTVKVMHTVFFDSEGVIQHEFLPQNKAILNPKNFTLKVSSKEARIVDTPRFSFVSILLDDNPSPLFFWPGSVWLSAVSKT